MRREKPIHFWTGTTVRSDEIRDIPAYNRANAVMWITYGFVFILLGVVGLAGHIVITSILTGIFCFCSLPVLIISYERIYDRYKN